MNQEANTRLTMWINAFPRVAGATAIVAGTIVLIGWIFDVPVLKSLHPAWVSMKANTAITFVLAGIALLLHTVPGDGRKRMVAQILGCLVGLMGLLTIAEYAFKWDGGIDQLLFNEPQGTIGTFSPGRMALNTAISFVLLGVALATIKLRTRWVEALSQLAALLVGMFGLLVLLAYVYDLPGFTGFAVYTRMALHSAACFILLSIGVICLQADVGLMAVVKGEGSGGYMARRLMLAAVGVPILLGWIVVAGEMRGLYGNQFGDVIAATAYVAIFLFLIWTIGRSLNKLDAERSSLELTVRQSEKEFRGLFDDAPVAYHEFDQEGRITRINQTELKMLGYQAVEMQGHFVWESLDDQEASRQSVLAKLAGTKPPAKAVERVYRRKDMTTIDVVSEDTLLRDADGRITGIRTTLQDVTDLKLAEKQLHESEERHRTLIHNLAEGVAIVNDSEQFMLANPAAEIIFGVAPGHLVGQSLQEFMDPGKFEEMQEETIRRRKGETASYEVQIIRPDREKRDLLVTVSPFVDNEGIFAGTLGIFRDLTERKRWEDSLKQSVSLFQATLESTADGILVVDEAGNMRSSNRKFAEMWKLPDDFVAGRDDDRAMNLVLGQLKDPEAFISKVRDLYANPEEGSFDVLEFKDGRVFERYSKPQRIDGKPVGRVWSFRDITARKQAEHEIKLLAHTVSSTKDCVSIADLEDKIIFVNNAFLQTYGFTREELVGQPVAMVRSVKTSPEIGGQILAGTLSGGWYGEIFNRRKDGTDFPIELWTSAVKDESGTVIATVGVARDITERKQADKLADALYAISQAIHSTNSLNELFELIHRSISRIIPANNFFIALLTDDGKRLKFPFERDEKGVDDSISIDAGDPRSLTVEVLQSKRPLLLDDVALYDRYSSGRTKVWVSAPKCWLGVPLMMGNEAIGVMAVQDYSRGDTYGQKDVALFESAAGQIAISIERKRAEKAIIASELEFRRVWESTFDGMRVVDGEGTILMVNEAYCTMIGKGREELVGKPFSIFTVESLQRQTLEKHKQRFSSGTIQPRAEKELVLWNERRVWFEVSSSFLEIEGRPKGVLSIFRDVTERKQAEDALAKKTALFSLVSNLTTDYIFVDRITDQGKTELDLLIGAVEQITGYTEEEYRAIGDWGATIHPDDREKDDRDFHKLLNNEKVVSEIRTFRKDGSTRWMKIYAHPIWDEKAHKVIGISGAVQDITEQKRAEQERESLIEELKTALENVRTLDGLVPICAHCKKIRDDKGYWNQLEKYIVDHTDAKLTHGICPECAELYFPGVAAKI